jgi:hypothetical protein
MAFDYFQVLDEIEDDTAEAVNIYCDQIASEMGEH